MYKLTESINQAIQNCLDSGSGKICLEDVEKTCIYAEWEAWDQDVSFDVVTVYFIQKGYTKAKYQIEETKISI